YEDRPDEPSPAGWHMASGRNQRRALPASVSQRVMSRIGTQLPNASSSAPLIAGTLQRKCACGNVGGGSCGSCGDKKDSLLQRAAINSAPLSETGVPPA